MADFITKECYEGAPYRHIHGAGQDFAWMQEELLRRGLKLKGTTGWNSGNTIYDMSLVMAAADVVLCRAGASTISELTAIAKPSILVPPQRHRQPPGENARVLASQGRRCCCWKRTARGRPVRTGGRPAPGPVPAGEMVRALNSMAVPDAGRRSIRPCGRSWRPGGPNNAHWHRIA